MQFQQAGTDSRPLEPKVSVFRLVWEKIPLFALAAFSIVVTFVAQQKGGALKSLESFPLTTRIANALISYVSYVGKMIWPHNLAVYYPYSGSVPGWQVAGAGLALICLTILFMWTARERPYLVVGWLWYLGTLVPVIGLVQVGSQAMADRYTYLPLVGLFIALAWGVPSLFARWHHRQSILAISATILLVSFTVCTWLQLRHWQNSITLFQHTLQVTTNNHFAHNNLGVALAHNGRLNEAISHYSKALRLKPEAFEVHNNLANALAAQGSMDEAIKHYFEALRLEPDYDKAHNNLGNALVGKGKVEEAINHYAEAIRLNPDYAGAHYNLANALAAQGSVDEAIKHYFEALRILPDWAGAHNNLGVSLEKRGKLKEAIDHYHEALRINPDYAKARNNLERAMRLIGKSAGTSNPVVKLLRGTV
jgi:Flp pilus assembly protein TadD